MDVKSESFLILTWFLLVAFIQATQLPTEERDKMLTTRRQMECIEEVRVDQELVVNVKRGQWKDSDKLLKEWVLCVMMKAGLVTREGVYRLDVAMAKAPAEHKDHILKMIDKCLSQKAIPAPAIAYNFAKCYQKKSQGNFTFATIF